MMKITYISGKFKIAILVFAWSDLLLWTMNWINDLWILIWIFNESILRNLFLNIWVYLGWRWLNMQLYWVSLLIRQITANILSNILIRTFLALISYSICLSIFVFITVLAFFLNRLNVLKSSKGVESMVDLRLLNRIAWIMCSFLSIRILC